MPESTEQVLMKITLDIQTTFESEMVRNLSRWTNANELNYWSISQKCVKDRPVSGKAIGWTVPYLISSIMYQVVLHPIPSGGFTDQWKIEDFWVCSISPSSMI